MKQLQPVFYNAQDDLIGILSESRMFLTVYFGPYDGSMYIWLSPKWEFIGVL